MKTSNKKNRKQKSSPELKFWGIVLAVLLMFAVGVFFSGCKPVERITTKTEYVERLKYDSIYLQKYDSIYVEKSGDTVRIEKYKTVYKDRIRIQKDTINRTDTIKILSTFPKSKETLEKPNKHGFLWWSGLLFWIVVFAFILFKVVPKAPILKLINSIFKH